MDRNQSAIPDTGLVTPATEQTALIPPGTIASFYIRGVPVPVTITDTPGTFIQITHTGAGAGHIYNPVTPVQMDITNPLNASYTGVIGPEGNIVFKLPSGSWAFECWKPTTLCGGQLRYVATTGNADIGGPTVTHGGFGGGRIDPPLSYPPAGGVYSCGPINCQ